MNSEPNYAPLVLNEELLEAAANDIASSEELSSYDHHIEAQNTILSSIARSLLVIARKVDKS